MFKFLEWLIIIDVYSIWKESCGEMVIWFKWFIAMDVYLDWKNQNARWLYYGNDSCG